MLLLNFVGVPLLSNAKALGGIIMCVLQFSVRKCVDLGGKLHLMVDEFPLSLLISMVNFSFSQML